MSVTSVEKDPESLTMTVTTVLDTTVERAWRLWADPGQFELWWGPPGYPVTVVDDDGRPNDGNAMTALIITINEREGAGAVMAIRTHFDSQEGMEQVLTMGFEEGMRTLFSRIEAVVAGPLA